MTEQRMAGDIILLNGGAKVSTLNNAYQRMVRRNAETCSHVAMTYAPFTLIHAVPGGIDVISDHDVFRSGQYTAEWRAVRHVEIERRILADARYEETIRHHAAFFFEQKYNFLVNVTRKQKAAVDDRSFCSELVAKVYRELGLPFDPLPEKTLPADILTATRGDAWKDVSELYQPVSFDDAFKDTIRDVIQPEMVAATGHQSANEFLAALLGESGDIERKQTDLIRRQLTVMKKSTRDILVSHRANDAVPDALRTLGVENDATRAEPEPTLPNDFWDSAHLKGKRKRK